jgi:hypothetical protein
MWRNQETTQGCLQMGLTFSLFGYLSSNGEKESCAVNTWMPFFNGTSWRLDTDQHTVVTLLT